MTIKTALKKESINICTFLFSQTYTVFWHLLFVWCVVTMLREYSTDCHTCTMYAVRLRPLSCKASCCAWCSNVYTRSLARNISEWSMFVVLLGSRVILLIHIWQFVSRWTLALCCGGLTKIMCVFNYSFDLLTRSPLQQMFDDLFRIIDNYCCCVPRHLLGGLVTTQYVRTPTLSSIHAHTNTHQQVAFYALSTRLSSLNY